MTDAIYKRIIASKIANEIYLDLQNEYEKELLNFKPNEIMRLKTEMEFYYNLIHRSKEKAIDCMNELKKIDELLLNKLMFDNDNNMNHVMVKDANKPEPYKILKSSEGLRQIGEKLQIKHDEATRIFDMIFQNATNDA